ncbi:hypothetical protein HDZ31DRAFT_50579 [Schizophyllum fasciatum]
MAPTALDALMNIASTSNLENSIGGVHDALLANGRINPAATPDATTLASIADAERSGVLTTLAAAATILTVFLLYGLGALYARLYRQRAWHDEGATPYPALRKDLNRVSTPLPAVSLAAVAPGTPKYVGYAVARDENNEEPAVSESLRNTPPGLVGSDARSETTLVDLSSGHAA